MLGFNPRKVLDKPCLHRYAKGSTLSLDSDSALVAAINDAAHTSLVTTGRAEAGTLGGGVFVDLGDGRQGVVTHFLGPRSHAELTAEIVNQLRRRGLPVAEHLNDVALAEDIYFLQERLPGAPSPGIPTIDLLAAIVEANDQFAHLLADHPNVPVLPTSLLPETDPIPSRHEQIGAYSPPTRRLLECVHALGARRQALP